MTVSLIVTDNLGGSGGGGSTLPINPNLPGVTVSDLYLDAVAGNDAHNGLTAPTAVKTFGKIAQLLKSLVLIYPPVTARANSGSHRYLDVHVINAPTLDAPVGAYPFDPLGVVHVILGYDVALRFFGTPAVAYTGTFSATTAIDHAAPALTTVTDAAISSWAPYVNQRIQIVGGARAGAWAWIAEDLGGDPGSKKAATSAFGTIDLEFGAPTQVTPQAGDNYEILTLQEVRSGTVILSSEGGSTDFSTISPRIMFIDLAFGDQNDTGTAPLPLVQTVDTDVVFIGCLSNDSIGGFGGGFVEIGNCWLAVADQLEPPDGAQVTCYLGGCTGATNFLVALNCTFDSDYLFQGTTLEVVAGGRAQLGTVGFFGAAGAGIHLVSGGVVTTGPGELSGVEYVYGSGNGGAGVQFDPGSTATYTTQLPNLTGTGGDLTMNAQTTAFAFSSVTGLYVGPTTLSWANIAAPIGAGTGFGGNAVHPQYGITFAQLL